MFQCSVTAYVVISSSVKVESVNNMYVSVSFIASAFLVLSVFGANGVISDKQCGVLENVVHKQAYLEKKVEAHDKLLGGESCTEGTIA